MKTFEKNHFLIKIEDKTRASNGLTSMLGISFSAKMFVKSGIMYAHEFVEISKKFLNFGEKNFIPENTRIIPGNRDVKYFELRVCSFRNGSLSSFIFCKVKNRYYRGRIFYNVTFYSMTEEKETISQPEEQQPEEPKIEEKQPDERAVALNENLVQLLNAAQGIWKDALESQVRLTVKADYLQESLNQIKEYSALPNYPHGTKQLQNSINRVQICRKRIAAVQARLAKLSAILNAPKPQ